MEPYGDKAQDIVQTLLFAKLLIQLQNDLTISEKHNASTGNNQKLRPETMPVRPTADFATIQLSSSNHGTTTQTRGSKRSDIDKAQP